MLCRQKFGRQCQHFQTRGAGGAQQLYFAGFYFLFLFQARRDNQALARSEQDVLETRRENENLQTVIETLKQQNRNLQISLV